MLLVAAFVPQPALAEILPPSRSISWQPGVPGGIPRYSVCFNAVTQYGADPTGVADSTQAIQRALDACPAGQAVYLPAGTYKTTTTLLITNEQGVRNNSPLGVVLRGAGPRVTTLNNVSTGTTVFFQKWSTPATRTAIVSGASKGSTSILVADATSISVGVGSHILVSQLNSDVLPITPIGYGGPPGCTWCGAGENGEDGNRAMTQIVKVTARSGNTLTLDRPLYFDFTNTPKIQRIDLLEGAGLEDLALEQTSIQAGGDQISAYGMSHCWVRNVESRQTWATHVRLQRSRGCEVRDNYLNGAKLVSSGRGYGLFGFGPNSDHLFENNIIKGSRHSMALEGGGSGIVFGYNYSVLPLLEDPTWLAEDAVTHGAHPFMNLWESNEFVKISMDNTWGSSSHNTFFRNNVTRSRSGTTLAVWAVDIEAKNHYENLVGNVLTTPGATGLVYRLGMWTPGSGIENPPSDPVVVDTVYLHGNFDYVTGATIWAAGNTDRTLPPSLYLAARPVFIGGVWPSIGPDLTPKTTAIPARLCYEALGTFDARACYYPSLAPPTGLQVR